MKTIILTQNQVALVSDADYDTLNSYKWYASKQRAGIYYAARKDRSDGKCKILYMHNFIMNMTGGVDHINHDGLDNQRDNLRLCSKSQNKQNARKNKRGTSIYKGVYFAKNKWISRININGKDKYIGRFTSEIEGALAYDAEAKANFKEFACLNFAD